MVSLSEVLPTVLASVGAVQPAGVEGEGFVSVLGKNKELDAAAADTSAREAKSRAAAAEARLEAALEDAAAERRARGKLGVQARVARRAASRSTASCTQTTSRGPRLPVRSSRSSPTAGSTRCSSSV